MAFGRICDLVAFFVVLVRGFGVAVLDLLFPQLLASNSIVSLRFGSIWADLAWFASRTGERNDRPVEKTG